MRDDTRGGYPCEVMQGVPQFFFSSQKKFKNFQMASASSEQLLSSLLDTDAILTLKQVALQSHLALHQVRPPPAP